MNKLTKVGLTALAGTLATVAGVNAGSIGVVGGSTITWVSESANSTAGGSAQTGNPLGWKNNLTFQAAGELDNGYSWAMNAYNSDAQALTSSNITFDLAGAGTVVFDNGAGGMGLDALDDMAPTAWEETHGTGLSTGLRTVSGVSGSAAVSYETAADALPMGTRVKVAWAPKADGGGLQADLGNSADANNTAKEGWDINLKMAPADGLLIFAGYSDLDNTQTSTSAKKEQGTYGLNYAIGGVSFGVAQSYLAYNDGATATVDYYDNQNWGLAFNVNDNLSISYGEYESKEEIGSGVGQTLKIDSIQIAYNLGGASLKIAESEADDAVYAASVTNKATTIALSLAF